MGVTPQQFEQMRRRVGTGKRSPAALLEATPPFAPVAGGVILGIDPSLRGTGFGVIRVSRGKPALLGFGVATCPPTLERSRCLVRIAVAIREAIRQHQPAVCVIESLFYAQNFQTALIMGEARGASLAVAAEADLPIFELAPRRVKQAVVGYGAAQKLAVAKMVQRILNLADAPPADAADALALALAYAQEQGRYSLAPPKRL